MADDKILIAKIDCRASVGVTSDERASTQRLLVDLEFVIDNRKPAGSDSIRDTINYSEVAAAVAEVCASQPFHLIETIAERIAERVLSDFPTRSTRVLVRKISPITRPTVAYVSVEIVRP